MGGITNLRLSPQYPFFSQANFPLTPDGENLLRNEIDCEAD